MCNDHHNHKRETSLKDKKRHQEDHANWSRRSFIQTLGLATGAGMTMGGFSVNALASNLMLPALSTVGIDDRILVLIRLKGGNDGLNTIVPLFDYSKYAQERPTLKWELSQLTSLDADGKFAIPDVMDQLRPLWDNGAMKVINGVGYENHSLSHFSSTDNWNSGNSNYEESEDKSGWLGRYILDNNPNYLDDLPDIPGAIKISSGSAVTFHNPDDVDLAVSFNTPDRLLQMAENGTIFNTDDLPDDCYYGDQVGYIRDLMNITFNYAPQISAAYTAGINEVNYTNNELSRQLSIVAKLIKGNLGTRLYMVTLDGFDTHENQKNKHSDLLTNLSFAINEFYSDLGSKANDVLSMTFSEFGRRINENLGGTDHGTAAPVMLFGPALNGNGILGDDPDMDDVDGTGNLRHGTDFRSVYATILENWLCVDPMGVDLILGDTYDRLAGLGLDCLETGIDHLPIVQDVSHHIRPNGLGGMIIEYELQRPGPIEVSIYSMMGQKVITLVNGYQQKGIHQATYYNRYAGLATVPLVYKIRTKSKNYSGKFIIQNGK